jgi:hypothetical protein
MQGERGLGESWGGGSGRLERSGNREKMTEEPSETVAYYNLRAWCDRPWEISSNGRRPAPLYAARGNAGRWNEMRKESDNPDWDDDWRLRIMQSSSSVASRRNRGIFCVQVHRSVDGSARKQAR